jgi:hypothetical protein
MGESEGEAGCRVGRYSQKEITMESLTLQV